MKSFLSRNVILSISKWHPSLLALWLLASGLPAAHLEAQNLQAIEQHLAKGVRKGNLTKEQAAVMIQALKEHRVSKKKKGRFSPCPNRFVCSRRETALKVQ